MRSIKCLFPIAQGLATIVLAAAVFAPAAWAGERVPDTVGLDLDTARSAIEREGFTAEVRYVSSGAEGVVLDQSPAGLSAQSPGTQVVLSVRGQTPKPTGNTTAPSTPPNNLPDPIDPLPSTPPGGTNPPSNEEPDAASAFASYPADPALDGNGPELPNTLGEQLFDAKDLLEQWKVEIEYTLAIAKHRGSVINQTPYPGTRLGTSETVVIVVARDKSENESEMPVPAVDGKTLRQATLHLDQVGFEINVRTRPSTPDKIGRVLSQRPLGGSLAIRGASVLVHVGRGSLSSTAVSGGVAGSGEVPRDPSTLPVGTNTAGPAVPVLRTPINAESIPVSFGASFDWTVVPGATEYDWELQQEMAGGIWKSIDVRRTKTGFRETTLKRGRYRWRVRSLAGTRPGDWAAFQMLYIY